MSIVSDNAGYRSVLKTTSLLGGVQVITILIGVVKTKLISLWLGPSGFGILSLFNSTILLISSISNLGLASSAVRDISKANTIQDRREELAKTIKAINRSVILTGVIGAFITIALSKYISQWTFDDNKYTYSFIMLSIVVFVNGLYSGQYATLQGVRRLKDMAKARVLGSFAGALLTLPFFFYYREKGIVIALIISSLLMLIISHYYVSKISLPKVNQTLKESFSRSLSTMKLGVMMAISAISVSVVEFILKTFISNTGGIDDVGLYQAGWTLNASYLGLVFTAMATDYFPRLSAISDDVEKMIKRINEQAEVAVLIIAPLIAIMICFMPIVISILYTDKFESISLMTRLLMLGALIKAASWAISFVFLAKGDGKTFLFNELGIKIVTIPSYILGYYYWGISGVGLAYIFNYVIYAIWVCVVAYMKYGIRFQRDFIEMLLFFIPTCFILVGLSIYENTLLVIVLETLVTALVVGYAVYKLNSRLNLIEFLRRKIKR